MNNRIESIPTFCTEMVCILFLIAQLEIECIPLGNAGNISKNFLHPKEDKMKNKSVRWIVRILVILLILGIIVPLGFRFFNWYWGWAFPNRQSEVITDSVCKECPVCKGTEAPAEVIPSVDGTCIERAKAIGAPVGSAICNIVTVNKPAERVQTGSKVSFGSITFDAETRVWILENFTVPAFANYSFDYSGRESYILDAPFAVGAEKNPVNGKNFNICWNIEGDCALPEGVNLFPTK